MASTVYETEISRRPDGTVYLDYLHFLFPPPITYFNNPITGFVDRINTA